MVFRLVLVTDGSLAPNITSKFSGLSNLVYHAAKDLFYNGYYANIYFHPTTYYVQTIADFVNP